MNALIEILGWTTFVILSVCLVSLIIMICWVKIEDEIHEHRHRRDQKQKDEKD